MDAVNQIVVGVALPETRPWQAANLDAATRLAVRQGFQLAAELGIPLKLAAVLPSPDAGLFASADDAEARLTEDQQAASALLDHLPQEYDRFPVKVTSTVRVGQSWLELLRIAEFSRNTLIICGTRSRNSVSRFLFGSTSLKLLRSAPGPVWVVKPRIDDDAVLDVLAATDLSDVGTNIISAGVTLGRAFPVHLTAIHVLEGTVDSRIAHTGASDETIAEWNERERFDAEEQLQEQIASTDARTLSSGIRTQLADGAADTCLLSAIEELDIDLLIMSSAGRSGIPGMLFGNTAERLLSELPCALLAIKPPDFVCPVDIS